MTCTIFLLIPRKLSRNYYSPLKEDVVLYLYCPDQTRQGHKSILAKQQPSSTSLPSPLLSSTLGCCLSVTELLDFAPEILNYSWLGSGLHVLQICMNNDNYNHNYCPSFSSEQSHIPILRHGDTHPSPVTTITITKRDV